MQLLYFPCASLAPPLHPKGWEMITKHSNVDSIHIFNEEETRDFMPELGVMVGYAVTVVIEPSNPVHKDANPNAWNDFRRYIAATCPGLPKIVIMQDLDKPRVVGSAWGEVGANIAAAIGCVGTITDGAIRDVDEMKNAGFHALARRMCVGHGNAFPVRWNCEVEVFGTKVAPGALIHADKHGESTPLPARHLAAGDPQPRCPPLYCETPPEHCAIQWPGATCGCEETPIHSCAPAMLRPPPRFHGHPERGRK